MKKLSSYTTVAIFLLSSHLLFAQPPVKILAGNLRIEDGSIIFRPAAYAKLSDSLSNILKMHPKDTTAMFYHSLLVYKSNDILVKPYPNPVSMSALLKANEEAIRAETIGMQDKRLQVLQANILVALCYQYSADESWKVKKDQVAKRRAQFNLYKKQANELFDKLEKTDSSNAYDYEKLKVKNEYPIQ